MITYAIPFELPTLNEYTNANRANRYGGAALKKDTEQKICLHLKEQGIVKLETPVYFIYTWICKDRRKDKDNIAFAKKFIQDALVDVGVIPNDKWDCIEGWSDKFDVCKESPGVMVEIYECSEEE